MPITYNTINVGGLHFYNSIVVAEKKVMPFKPITLKIGEEMIIHLDDAL